MSSKNKSDARQVSIIEEHHSGVNLVNDADGDYILVDIETFEELSNLAVEGKIATVGYDELRKRLVNMFHINSACSWAWHQACEMEDKDEQRERNDNET